MTNARLVASLPLMLAVEGVGAATRFADLARADPTFRFHMLVSGLLLYLYNRADDAHDQDERVR